VVSVLQAEAQLLLFYFTSYVLNIVSDINISIIRSLLGEYGELLIMPADGRWDLSQSLILILLTWRIW